MMPIIAHNLFECMQIMIGAVKAFTGNCVLGLQANRSKAEGWLERNAIVVTALNPLIGYAEGARLVKEAMASERTVRQVAVEKAAAGLLKHRDEMRQLSAEEVEAVLSNMRRLTEGGIFGGGAGG
jgi:fumarate hydratase class II